MQFFATYKKQLSLFNILGCFFVGLCMLIACFSYSTSMNLINTFYYGTSTFSFHTPSPQNSFSSGCDDLQQYELYLSPLALSACMNSCQNNIAISPAIESCFLMSWDFLTTSCLNPGQTNGIGFVSVLPMCDLANTCKSIGAPLFAFVLITGFLALITMIVFELRKKSDTELRRLLSIVLCL